MKNQTTILADTYFISERLKEIDESYFLVFNFDKQKFEVHSTEQGKNTYCLTVPYPVLDERTLALVRKTRGERLDALIEEMEKENEVFEKKQVKDAVNRLKEVEK